jgi:hypothetical protein
MNVDRTLFIIEGAFEHLSQSDKEKFADGVNDLFEKYNLVEEKTTEEQLIEAMGVQIVDKIMNNIADEEDGEWVTIRRAAEIAKVDQTTIRKRIHDKELHGEVIDGIMHITTEDARSFEKKARFIPGNAKKDTPARKMPSAREVVNRKNTVLDVVTSPMKVSDVAAILLDKCDYSNTQDEFGAAITTVREMAKENQIAWEDTSGNGNMAPGQFDTVMPVDYQTTLVSNSPKTRRFSW